MTRVIYGEKEPRIDERFIEPQRHFARQRRRPWRSFLGCCLPLVIFFIGIAVICVAVVVKTGAVTIPYLSDLLYRTPLPERIIKVSNEPATVEQGIKMAVDPEAKTAAFNLTEEQLTVVLRQALTGGAESFLAPSLQAAIEPSGIEVFGLLIKPISATIILTLVPSISRDSLAIQLTRAQIGNIMVPVPVAEWLGNHFFKSQLDAMAQQFRNVSISRLTLQRGSMTVVMPLSQLNSLPQLDSLFKQ